MYIHIYIFSVHLWRENTHHGRTRLPATLVLNAANEQVSHVCSLRDCIDFMSCILQCVSQHRTIAASQHHSILASLHPCILRLSLMQSFIFIRPTERECNKGEKNKKKKMCGSTTQWQVKALKSTLDAISHDVRWWHAAWGMGHGAVG